MTSSGFVVVVGVSGTSHSPRALRFAAAEAAAHRGSVVAVRAWKPAVPMTSGTHPPLRTYDPQVAYAAQQARLREDVGAVLGERDDVECRVVEGGRRKVLVEQARGADLLVLDAPRQLDLSGGAIFAHRLLYTALCPVVIMPPGADGDQHRLARA